MIGEEEHLQEGMKIYVESKTGKITLDVIDEDTFGTIKQKKRYGGFLQINNAYLFWEGAS